MSKIEKVTNDLTAGEILTAAGYESVSNPDEYLISQLKGAVKTLRSVSIDSVNLGMSKTNVLVMARGIREAKKQESQVKKIKIAKAHKETLQDDFYRFVLEMPNRRELAQEACGIAPAGTIGTYTAKADGEKVLSYSIKAIRLNPDSKELDRIKESKKLMAANIETVATGAGAAKTRELMELEAGTKDSKSISLLVTDEKKAGCIQDEEFKYQVSVSLKNTESECVSETPETKLRKAS